MGPEFDPYQAWLGISPEEQPLTLYRLLGLRPFEDAPDAIEQAARQSIARLENLQSGGHGADARRLLQEIATARDVLLNPAVRADYDVALRRLLDAWARGETDDKELTAALAGILKSAGAMRLPEAKSERLTLGKPQPSPSSTPAPLAPAPLPPPRLPSPPSPLPPSSPSPRLSSPSAPSPERV
jgi:curved DNA-binding protein CbpA